VKGFLLLEALLTMIVIGVALVALNAALIMMVKSNAAGEASVVSTHLSQRMLEEVRLRRWDENTPAPSDYTKSRSAVGLDAGESASDKRTFDDIDDFQAWTEGPPLDPVMNVLSAFADYTTSVTVRYVDVTTLDPVSPGTKTDFKAISICSWRKQRKSICLDTIITNR